MIGRRWRNLFWNGDEPDADVHRRRQRFVANQSRRRNEIPVHHTVRWKLIQEEETPPFRDYDYPGPYICKVSSKLVLTIVIWLNPLTYTPLNENILDYCARQIIVSMCMDVKIDGTNYRLNTRRTDGVNFDPWDTLSFPIFGTAWRFTDLYS